LKLIYSFLSVSFVPKLIPAYGKTPHSVGPCGRGVNKEKERMKGGKRENERESTARDEGVIEIEMEIEIERDRIEIEIEIEWR